MSDLLKATAHESLVHNTQIRTVANPGAGNELVVPVPSGEDWRFLALRATFTASAAVANRTPGIVFDDQTGVGIEITSAFQITAGLQFRVCWVGDLANSFTSGTAGVLSLTAPQVVLPTAWRIRTLTPGLDVGDAWSAITVFFERLDEPPYRQPLVGTALDDEVEHEIAMRAQGG